METYSLIEKLGLEVEYKLVANKNNKIQQRLFIDPLQIYGQKETFGHLPM